jgi:hypothetical protein
MQMGKDGGNGAAFAPLQSGSAGSPSPRLKVLEQKLVHTVVGRVRF